MINHINGNSLTKVRLEAVYTTVKNGSQLVCIPAHSIRICEIHKSHTCLPVVCLPDSFSIRSLQKISIFGAFPEKCSSLGNIRVDPYTDFQSFVMILFQSCTDIREISLIPGKITPVEFLHPETVKMEYTERNIPFFHSFNKGSGCLFIIISGK